MNSEKAVTWLEREGFNQWILTRGDEEKVSSYDSENESVSEGVERFRDIIELQQPGKFLLKGYKGKSKQASAMSFRFDIKPEISNSAPRGFQGNREFDAQAIFDKAEESALRKFEMNQWRKDIESKIAELRKDVSDLAQALKDLNDDEEDNDETALDRVSDVAEKLPNLMNGLQSLSGFLSKK